MKIIAITVLAAVALAGPALSVRDDKSTECGTKPNSYVPRHSKHHVYGTPIQAPIVGHANIRPSGKRFGKQIKHRLP